MPIDSEPTIPPEQGYIDELRALAKERQKDAFWSQRSENEIMRPLLNNIHFNRFTHVWMAKKGFRIPAIWKDMTDEQKDKQWNKKPTTEDIADIRDNYGFSDKYASSSTLDMYEDFCKAIENSGLNENDVKAAIERATDPEDLESIFLPIYVELRKMGYSRKDIVS